MKKIIFNISDCIYEKLKFEAIYEKKGIVQILKERLNHKPFEKEVEQAFDAYMEKELNKIIED